MSYPVAVWCLSGLRADDMTGPNNYTHTPEGDACLKLRRQLANEKKLRLEAERNAMRFHALLLKARVELIRAGKT